MRALVRHHKVDVLVLRRGEQAYVERAGNARILRVPVPDGEIRGRVEAFRRALRRQLEGADYDVVHVSDGWAGQTVLELQPQLKYAVVYDAGRSPLTGPLPLDVSVVSELQRAEADCAARADLVLAPTEPARQFLAGVHSGSVHSDRVHLVAPGVDVDLFDWDQPPNDGPPLILYIGTLSQGRGIQVLLGAMIELVRRTDAELILAGRAGREFRQNLAATLRELNLESRVTFRGVLDHARVPELISRATVCVAPAAPETKSNRLALYPTKILEYLACQRAVVAPRRSSVSLLLRHEQTGLLFEPGQPSDLAETIERALTDHALRARIARAGYDLVRRAHSASSTRRELTSAYTWLGNLPQWRERFAASDDQSSPAELRMPGAQDTEAAGWPRPDYHANKSASFESGSFDSDEVMLSEPTGSGSIETSLGEGVGEVTRVEISPLLDEVDTRSTSLYPIDQEKVDDWVVEDSNTRPVQQSGVVGDEPVADDEAAVGGIRSSMDASFVAGEIRSDDTAEVSLGDEKFEAVSSLLGVPVEEEKTRLFELPANMIDGRTLEKNVLEARMQEAKLKEAKAASAKHKGAKDREATEREAKMMEGKTQIADVRRLGPGENARSATRSSSVRDAVDSGSELPRTTARKRAARVQSERKLPPPTGSRPPPFSPEKRRGEQALDPGVTDLDLGSVTRPPPSTIPPTAPPPPPFPEKLPEPPAPFLEPPAAFPDQATAVAKPPPPPPPPPLPLPESRAESHRTDSRPVRSIRRDEAGNPVTQPFPRIDPLPSDKRPGSDSS